jgi:endonuclease YncB( thermonuclease family)
MPPYACPDRPAAEGMARFFRAQYAREKILADAETIRFDGIAAPEWDTPAGEAATKALREMVLGKLVSCS